MNERLAERRCGFTLAELLIVITIITISATLIVPVVINLSRTRRVGGGARAIQALLAGAKARASAQRAVHGLRLYEVSAEEAGATQRRVACLISVPLDGGDTAAVRQERELLPNGLRVFVYAAGDPNPRPLPEVIWFQSDGTVAPNLSTPILIQLVNAADSSDTLAIVVRRTGAIEVLD